MTYRNIELDPETEAALTLSKQLAAQFPPASSSIDDQRRSSELARQHWIEGGPNLAYCQERSIMGLGRYVPVMYYRAEPDPVRLLPAMLYLHGGGYRTGNHRSNMRQMQEIAQRWGGVVISADYQHVPEARFPVAVQETSKLLKWLHEHGRQWGIDGERIAIAGASAGASVVLGSAVELGYVPWIKAGVSIVGALSSDISTESMMRYGQSDLFPLRKSITALYEDYVPHVDDRKDPRVDPFEADPNVFPTTFVAAAEFDSLRDSSERFAHHLEKAGKLARFTIYEGTVHMFFGWSKSVQRAAQCVNDVADFLCAQLPAH